MARWVPEDSQESKTRREGGCHAMTESDWACPDLTDRLRVVRLDLISGGRKNKAAWTEDRRGLLVHMKLTRRSEQKLYSHQPFGACFHDASWQLPLS